MPDRAIDDRHAAWYSDTHNSAGALIENAVAVLGWRDGSWFAHIHAYWNENGAPHLGHLLPQSLMCANKAEIRGFGLKGAKFEAAPDDETEFTLFRVKAAPAGPDLSANAVITTLAPFEDVVGAVADLARTAGFQSYSVQGLGSLAGARFHDAEPMTGLISEILVLPGAGKLPSQGLTLPVRCVDLNGNFHAGRLRPDGAPTLVTCELLIRKSD